MLVAPLDNTLDQAQARPSMTQPQRRAWTMVASMFVTVAIVYGLSFDIIGLFYNSLAKEFALSRARFSSLATSFSLSFLVGGLVAGWLLDRIGAQFVVVGGAMVVIAGLLVASAASSFNAMLLAYFLIGLGVSAAIITSYMVVNNWFSERRTLALAVTFCGLSVGELAMAWTATYAIGNYGWRSAYLVFAAMVLVLVIPLDLITVRTRPASAGTLRSVAEAGRALPGLELARAFRIGALYTRADLSRLRNQCQHFTRARSHPAARDRFFAGASRKNLGHPAGFDYFGTPAYGLFG